MSCRDTQTLLHRFVDDELDGPRSREIERHLGDCPACAQAYAGLQAVRAAVKGGVLVFQPSPHLRQRIEASLRQAANARPPAPALGPRLLAVAASLAVAVITTWGLVRLWSVPSADELLTRQVVASHVRAQMPLPGHRVDVASPSPHTVKTWFKGRLDYAPYVEDLTRRGFPLVGGRVDYLDNRPVAALVYQRRQHFISLFVWPSAPGPEAAAKTETRQGFQLVHWAQAGMTCWAVSDLSADELRDFVRTLQDPPG